MTPGHLYSGDSDSTALHQRHPVLYLLVESLNKIIPVHITSMWFPDFYFIILVVKKGDYYIKSQGPVTIYVE